MDRFLVHTARDEWLQTSESDGRQSRSGGAGQRTLGSLAKVVTLPRGVTPRVFSNDFLLGLKATLENDSAEEAELLVAIRQLSSLVITEQHLRESQVGKTIKQLSRSSRHKSARELASGLLSAWKQQVEDERMRVSTGQSSGGPMRASGHHQTQAANRMAAGAPYPRNRPGQAYQQRPSELTSGPGSFWADQRPPQPGDRQQPKQRLPVSSDSRKRARGCLLSALTSGRSGPSGHMGSAPTMSMMGSSSAGDPPEHLKVIVNGIEEAVHHVCHGESQGYPAKIREISKGLRRNGSLRGKVLAGWVEASELASMSAEQLAAAAD